MDFTMYVLSGLVDMYSNILRLIMLIKLITDRFGTAW